MLFPWPRAAPTACRTDLRLLACSNYARRSHALRKTFTTFRRCICKRPPTVAVKMGDNEDLICDERIRSAFSDCAIQVHLLPDCACAASVSCFSEHLLSSWPCRSGWRGWRLRLPIIHRIVCRRRNEQMLSMRRPIVRTVMTVIATSSPKPNYGCRHHGLPASLLFGRFDRAGWLRYGKPPGNAYGCA